MNCNEMSFIIYSINHDKTIYRFSIFTMMKIIEEMKLRYNINY